MRRLLFLTVLLAACGTAGAGRTTVTSSVPVTTDISTGAGGYHVAASAESRETTHVVALSPANAWSGLPAVYAQLGLEGGVLDADTRFYGTRRQAASGRLAGVRLAEYVDCGTGNGGLPVANTYRVHLSVGTRVEEVGERAQLRSAVIAEASPQTVSGPSVRCTTTGRLEARIAELLGQGAGAAPQR